MKPFNRERAIAGDAIVYVMDEKTYPARLICSDRKQIDGYSLTVLVSSFDPNQEDVYAFNEQGLAKPGCGCLFMAPVKRQEWGNIYLRHGESSYELGLATFPTEDDAREHHCNSMEYINTVLIREWEE